MCCNDEHTPGKPAVFVKYPKLLAFSVVHLRTRTYVVKGESGGEGCVVIGGSGGGARDVYVRVVGPLLFDNGRRVRIGRVAAEGDRGVLHGAAVSRKGSDGVVNRSRRGVGAEVRRACDRSRCGSEGGDGGEVSINLKGCVCVFAALCGCAWVFNP